MSVINSEIISRISTLQNQIWQNVSLTVSETSNTPITFGSPLTVSAKTSDLYADIGSAMVVIQFAFASQQDISQVVLIPADSFLPLASTIRGDLIEEIDENLLSDVRPQLEAIVQGICMSIGNIKNEAMVASGLSIRHQVFNFPPNLQRQEELIRIQIAISGEELNGNAVWLMEADTANLILGVKEENEEGDEDSSSFLQVSSSGNSAANQAAPTHPYEDANALELLLDIPMEICVELGRLKMMIKDVVELGTGSIVEIDKAAGEPVDLMVNGRLVAKGEVVVIEDNFGVRITEILTPHERLVKLGEVA